MTHDKALSKKIAEQYLADEDSLDLSESTSLEDAAAELLAESDDRFSFQWNKQ